MRSKIDTNQFTYFMSCFRMIIKNGFDLIMVGRINNFALAGL